MHAEESLTSLDSKVFQRGVWNNQYVCWSQRLYENVDVCETSTAI